MPRDTERSRSRSPYRREKSSRQHRHRSRSPHRGRNSHERPAYSKQSNSPTVILPLNARPISKHDLRTYRPMFALYLDIQKQKDIEDLADDEVRGRWKSFVGKWNRGELAEGWYDPKTLEKAIAAENSLSKDDRQPTTPTERVDSKQPAEETEAEDDEFGPPLPADSATSRLAIGNNTSTSGPSIPSMQDLRAAYEQRREETEAEYEERLQAIHMQRRHDRKLQQSRLDDLVPRAEAGTKERQLERKREVADSNRDFAAAKEASGDIELPDREVLGDEDSLAQLKKMQKDAERKKNEREIRREEALRARIAEREERVKGMREKEEKTMKMLRDIAKARFGPG